MDWDVLGKIAAPLVTVFAGWLGAKLVGRSIRTRQERKEIYEEAERVSKIAKDLQNESLKRHAQHLSLWSTIGGPDRSMEELEFLHTRKDFHLVSGQFFSAEELIRIDVSRQEFVWRNPRHARERLRKVISAAWFVAYFSFSMFAIYPWLSGLNAKFQGPMWVLGVWCLASFVAALVSMHTHVVHGLARTFMSKHGGHQQEAAPVGTTPLDVKQIALVERSEPEVGPDRALPVARSNESRGERSGAKAESADV